MNTNTVSMLFILLKAGTGLIPGTLYDPSNLPNQKFEKKKFDRNIMKT